MDYGIEKKMTRVKTQSTKRRNLLIADLRRWTQKEIPFKNITAEVQRAQRIKFLFVGRRRQTKTFLKLELKFLPNRRLPIGQKGFTQRTLRLCGEMTESLSAKICG